MSQPAPPWQPTVFKRFVKALPTSACTVIVETDAGRAYLKALGNDEGPWTLACELVGTRLAAWFGLKTFDYAMIDVTPQDEIPFHNGKKALPGKAFISRGESGEPWSGSERQLKKLFNAEDIARLVVFDTWTLNCDRHSLKTGAKLGDQRINRNNVFLSEEAPPGQLMLKAMDHTHCFSCGREVTKRLYSIDNVKKERVFGRFPEFGAFIERDQVRQAANDLRKIDRRTVEGLTGDLPREWEVSLEALEALRSLIVERAGYVAGTIEHRLFQQRVIDFDGEESQS